MAMVVAFAATGCYNDFDAPAPAPVYTDEVFDESGAVFLTIAEAKQIFTDQYTLENNGDTGSYTNTKYVEVTDEVVKAVGGSDATDLYIKGKVISNDEEGNVYKTLYLSDETGGIEIKLGTGLFLSYPMGTYDPETQTMPTHYVYVKLKGLFIGNYRMMLSIGNGPTDSFNKLGEHKFYANSNIENKTDVKNHVFLGEETLLEIGTDILVIDESNKDQFFGKDNADKLGRLVLIKGVTCHYGTIGTNIYPAWMDRYKPAGTSTIQTVFKPWYTWAFNSKKHVNATNLYGSVLFSYDNAMPTSTLKAGVYVVRSSGYSRFAGKPVVRDGAKGDILAIFGIYSKSWTYPYGAYQLTVSRYQDIMFTEPVDVEKTVRNPETGKEETVMVKMPPFLTEDEVLVNTPNGYPGNVPDASLPNGGYDAAQDSYFTPSTADDEEYEE